MHLSWVFVFTALLVAAPTLASAIPSPRPGTVIPLTRRGNYFDDLGVANATLLSKQVENTRSKLKSRVFEAYEKNTNNQLQTIKQRGTETGSEPLTDDSQMLLWFGTISVGTPSQSFTVQIDTGSSDLLLPGTDCGFSCSNHRIYNPDDSSTSENLDQSFSIQFVDGSFVNGNVYTDTISIAGLTVKNQDIGVATQYSSQLETRPFDGTMGMGFSQISKFGKTTLTQNLVNHGIPQFSVKLATSGSELFLGGADNSKFTGSFVNVPVTTPTGFWQVNMDSMNVNGRPAISNLDAIIDTGTSHIVGPTDQVKEFYSAVPGAMDASQTFEGGFYTFPCDPAPQISLTFGGKSFTLSSDTFSLGTLATDSSQCVGAISALDDIQSWFVGNTFLMNVYTRFDIEKLEVGFANLA